jgi:hypothetical protein
MGVGVAFVLGMLVGAIAAVAILVYWFVIREMN